MHNKLRENADHFPTESLKITYIKNRTNSKAARHIASHMRPEHPKQYTIAEQIFEHLLSIYKDANKLKNAKKDFCNLMMHKYTDYQTFETEFLHLAGEAEIPTANYKDKFMDKLLFNLQKMVAAKHAKDRIFIKFRKIVAQSAHTLKTINKA
jgi:hypothetical protein